MSAQFTQTLPASYPSVVLAGFTGSGKSTVGRTLADMTATAFVDLDDEVERMHTWEKGHALKCRDIYSTYGRECFQQYELLALGRMVDRGPMVLATGGAAPLHEDARAMMRALGTVVYLRCSPRELFARLTVRGFPASMGIEPSTEQIELRLAARSACYESAAHLTVDCDGTSAEQVATEIIRRAHARAQGVTAP